MDGPEPIEIELTSHEARSESSRRVWRRASATSGPHEPGDDGPEPREGDGDAWLSSDRGKLVTTGAVVGVIALLLGWMLGRSGDGGTDLAAADGTSTTTTASSPTTLPISGDTIERADFDDIGADPPSSTRVERATTTVPDGPTVEAIAIDPRLQGTPLRLVGVDLSGSLVEIDLENGVRTDYNTDFLSPDPSTFAAGDDWVIADGNGGPVSEVMWSDGSRSSLMHSGYWRAFPIAGTDMLWTADDSAGEGFSFQRVDLGGESMPGVIELPSSAWPVATDPATGGLIVQTLGRVYSMLPDETTHLGIGWIVAVSADQVLLGDCDERLECGLRLVDRSTGDVSVVPETDTSDNAWQPAIAGVESPVTFSPDGRRAVVTRAQRRGNDFGVIDVGTGEYLSLGTDTYPTFATWTPDGAFAIYLDIGQQLIALDLATAETFPVLDAPRQWRAVATRPVAPTDG